MDFRLADYMALLDSLSMQGYPLINLLEYITHKPKKFVILRHDVDKRPDLALSMARAEHKRAIHSTYYFRIVRPSNQPGIIRQISEMGHEIGYHYEDLAMAKGNYELAIECFSNNLSYFRKLYPVKTICMHGSPLSRWDNRMLWNRYDYHDYGLLAEPYIDLEKEEIFYLTDTGRRWDGDQYSLRDRLSNDVNKHLRWTKDLITAVANGTLPERVMITTHPQRWTTNLLDWTQELVAQRFKNFLKKRIIRR